MRKIIIVLFLTAVLPVAGLGAGSASAEEKLTLKEAITAALKDNNELRAKEWSHAAQQNEKGIARSYLLPRVTLEERFSRTNNPTYVFMSKLNQERFTAQDFDINSLNNPRPYNNYQTMFGVEQPIFSKQAYVGLDMADEAVKTSGLELARKKEKVGFDVYRAYVSVMTAKEYMGAARGNLDNAKEHQRIAGLRYKSGLGLYSDVLRADVAVSAAERGLLEAEKNVNISKRMLGLLIGRNDTVDIADEKLPEIQLADLPAYEEAAKGRADLKAMESRYRNSKNAVRLAQAGYWPVLGLGANYEMDDHNVPFGSDGKSWQIMAFLKINIFDGLKRENERSKAVNQVNEAGEYLEGLRKQIDFEVYDAFYNVKEAEKKYELARAARDSAEEGMRLVQKRYENSLAPMVSLLDAQSALEGARADSVAAHGQYLTTVAGLEYSSGRLLKIIEQ